ncbi:MAG: hypothetical protein WBK77_04450 [Alphaproteobacteria bacterium]
MERRNKTDRRAIPASATASIQKLIQVSQNLIALGERETQALLQGDMMNFGFLQDEKDRLVNQYTSTSEEFRSRLEDFRSVDKSLLGRLEELQKSLSEKTQSNNVMILQMHKRTESNVHKTLLMAQEYGQHKRTRFEGSRNTEKQRGAE